MKRLMVVPDGGGKGGSLRRFLRNVIADANDSATGSAKVKTDLRRGRF